LDRFFTTRRSVQNNTAEGKTTYYRPSTSNSKAHSKNPSKKTPTSNSEAHLSPPLGDRPLVEEREEFFALSREEEKAV
jgi:hypothetical protein